MQDISVPYGTSEEDAIAELVAEITIKDSAEQTYVVRLDWAIADYDPNTGGSYKATGTLELPAGVAPKS